MNNTTAREILVKVLDDMEQKALQMKIQGVGVACYGIQKFKEYAK